MAKSSKNKTDKPQVDEAEIKAAEAGEISDSLTDDTVEELEEAVSEDAPIDDLEMEIVEDAIEPEPIPEPEDVVEEAAVPAPASEPARSSGAGFVPLLLGGVAAGAIGYGIATYYPLSGSSGSGDEMSAQIAAQSDQIAALEARLDETPEAPDLSGVETQIADVSAQVSGLSSGISEQLAALDTRLLEVEKRPSGDGTLSDTALAAYQRELEELRAELDAQKDDVMSAAAQAEADLAAARAEAERLEQEALAATQAAAARAALNRVAAAVDTGAPYADALADLDPSTVPDALVESAATGVATTAQLVEDFPAAARAALATARAEGLTDDASGLGGFLRNQFDVRSTAPKEGPGADAVLSRAEAAVKEGRIADALAEIEALPEVARAEITDWTARATERADVLDAIATLSETYN